ncbi:MAG: hypothetical protein ETSY1_19385 [Candidatus Entotheonella factor]|uniref:Glycosyl transferase family 1 domain-containing protein n=2 Tax=Candidatus Entotheonella TaxID=93171 RepID=W4LLT3_ENTF1|nr:MAG: hypothetical protein ETSY1_19385 [Candidatus Entotheonella factor]
MTGSAGLCGGIANANANILRAFVDLAQERQLGLSVLSYLEHGRDRPEILPTWATFHGFEGDKWRFSQHLLCNGWQSALIAFDHVTLALPILPYAALKLVPTLIFTHGSESWKRVRQSSRWSLQCATLCLANSNYTLKRMRAYLPPFRGAACPLGLSPHFTAAAPPDGPLTFEAADGTTALLGPHCLLIAARMDDREGQKGHRELIRILPALKRDVPDVQLVCAGPGDDRHALQQLARHHGVADAVFFPGYVPLATLQALYQHCYALVMPSRQEGFGLAYLEAMQYAKPCLGCFHQGAEDVIAHGETGLLVDDPADAPSLLGSLNTLLQDPTYAQWLGQNGYKRLQREFTARHYQARLKAHITGLLD